MAGFNFRSTEVYVTDGTGQTFVGNDSYPTTRDGVTFGYEAGAGAGLRNRDNTIDPRLAGVHQFTNTNGQKLFSTNSGDGVFDVTIAVGDADFAYGPCYLEIVEVNSSQVFQSVLAAAVSNQSGAQLEFFDATGVKRTSALDWVNNNVAVQVTVASGNSLGIRVGDSAATASGTTQLAHFAYESVDGQQPQPEENYTFDMNDVTTYTSATAGLPLSSATYQNQIEVTDGTDTAVIDITRNPKSGYTVVETVSAVSTKGSIFETRVGGAPSDGSQIYYPTAGNTAITASGIITTDSAGFVAFVWCVTSKEWDVVTFDAAISDTNYIKPIVTSIESTITSAAINLLTR